jgi:hypothetical protein
MSRIRDIASILTSASVLSTDVETAAAITTHNNATTSVHGISDTSALATQTYVQNNKGINKGNTASRPSSPSNGDLYYNTETSSLEVYDAGWWLPNTTPGIPTSPVATNSGSARAFNNGRASVSFTPATSGGKATSFTVTSTPGSYTNTGSSSPILVTGLQSSTQYTYAVTATGPVGTSFASSASSAVTATTVPQAPSITSVTAGDAQVSVAFSANATGGSVITGYTITSSPGNITATGATSPIIVTGLTNATAYTFTATATNANGTSIASSASSSITPAIPAVIAEILVVAGGGGGQNGGGGAGGLSYHSSKTLTTGVTFTITVGGGGVGKVVNTGTAGTNGSDSVFDTITSIGGGSSSSSQGSNGGSGAGGYSGAGLGGSATQGNSGGAIGYGFAGSGGGNGRAGGGGGAGAAAVDYATAPNGQVGGDGRQYWDSDGTLKYYAGGGGGRNYGNGTAFAGGLGGGGTGDSSSGTANTGGGGGTSGGGSPNGGSGTVILRYPSTGPLASSTTGSPTVNATGGYRYYKFTGSGSITF